MDISFAVLFIAILFLVGWAFFTWNKLKIDAEGRLYEVVKRQIFNMHHGTQDALDLWTAMRFCFGDGARDRVWTTKIVPYARRLWIASGDERELQVDNVDYGFSVSNIVAKAQ